MNKFFTTFFLLIFACIFACAQVPEKMTYQLVVHDVNNSLVTNRNVSARIWILQGSADGSAVYIETQSATTNANGMMTLVLGEGTVVAGSLSAINWANGPYFLKTEIDPAGGGNYTLQTVQELLSVPYALYANEAANSFSGDYNDLTNTPEIPTVPANVSAFTNDAGYLTPATLQDAVTIPTNVSAFTNDTGYITPAQIPAQVNADWNATDGAAQILNKPTIPAAANDATLTLQQNGTLIGTFTADASSDTTLNMTIPTATDQLVNDIGYLTPDSLPTNVSTFTNDAGYLTVAQCGDTSLCEMANMISSLQSQIGQLQAAIGQLAVELDSLEEARFTCGTSTVKDFDNNVYNTVQLGNQCWMKENLRTTHYADGTEIPTSIYLSSSVAYRYYPNNDTSLVPTYGYLYNWTAVMHSSASSSTNPSGVQGICPTGWHVPSRAEWTQLTDFVSGQVQYACNGNNLKIAKALSSTTGWNTSGASCAVGNNQSTNDATGFAALPTGYYYNVPYFFGSTAFFWSAEQNNDNNSSAWHYRLDNESGTVSDNIYTIKASAEGVRCLRDVLGLSGTLPTVTTSAVSDITPVSATCGGEVTVDNDTVVTARGVCWGTSQNPTLADSHTTDSMGTGSFTSILTNLTPNTTYYVRAYATNSLGTSYGQQLSFTTQTLVLPTVTTAPVSDITYNSATCGGEVTSEGNVPVIERGICWTTSGYPMVNDDHIAVGSGLGSFTATLTGLATGTHYFVRAYAISSAGTVYGDLAHFTTQTLSLPSVTTAPVSDITYTTAVCGGSVTADGGTEVTARGVCWGTSQNPTLADSHTTDSMGTGSFTSILTNLTPNTTYYVRAYATNSLGTSYGQQESFTTQTLVLPTVILDSISNITFNTAVCNSTVTAAGNGPVIARGVCWKTNEIPSLSDSHTTDSTGLGSFTSNITDLTPGTTYFVRAYATNIQGTKYSQYQCFTTPTMSLPAVTTESVRGINYTIATCEGLVTSEGDAPVIERGFCWSTYGYPMVDDNHIAVGSGSGNFIATLTDLTFGTYYHVRAYATSSAGTTYGNLILFTTLSYNSPEVITASASDVTKTSFTCGGDVAADGGAPVTARGICWNTTANVYPTLDDDHTTEGSGLGEFTSNVTGLTPNTIYYVRAYATNSAGTNYGDIVRVTTSPLAVPTVTNLISTDRSYTTVVCNAEVMAEGDAPVTERGFCWSEYGYPTLDDDHIAVGSGLGSYMATLSGLTIGTGYHVRAYATSSLGTAYSDLISVSTRKLSVPMVETAPVSDITQTSFTSGGSVIEDGGTPVTAQGICWNTASNVNPTLADNYTTDSSGLGDFISFVTGLDPNTLYYVRAYATNSTGTGYGNVLAFWTSSLSLPTVTTAPVTDLAYTTVTCSGEVISEGDAPVTERGICWITNGYPTVVSDHIAAGSGSGSFTVTLSGLDDGTTYFARAYAISSAGTVYGELISFTTLQTLKPTVMTDSISNISYTSFTCNGNVTDDGGDEVTARGVCWSTTGDPTLADDHTIDGSGLGEFTSNVTGLASNTYYRVRAYATNSKGTNYGRVMFVKTLPFSLPTVTTNPITDVTKTSFTCGGNVTADGGDEVTARGICWNTTANVYPTLADNHTTDGSGLGDFTDSIADLTPNTLYFVRAYATNSAGTQYGGLKHVWTLPLTMPSVTTAPVTDITEHTATCGGEVTVEGDAPVTERGVCWANTSYPTVNDNHIAAGSGLGSFTATITGLSIGVRYFVRAYAISSLDTVYGEMDAFTTMRYYLPSVNTDPVSDISKTSFTCGGDVTADGGTPVIARGVCWNTTGNPTLADDHTTDGSGLGVFTSNVTGLTPNTFYYVCAYATNSQGTSYGSLKSFWTLPLAEPTVTTVSVTDITYATATCGGEVTDEGDAPVTERGVCWGTSVYPTVNDNHIAAGSGLGSFTVTLSGLDAGTTYYVRAYAISSAGITYSVPVYFITSWPTTPTVITDTLSNIAPTSFVCGGRVTDDGGFPVTARGICWSNMGYPTLANDHTTDGAGLGDFTSSVTDLIPGQVYYIRAYATNERGTTYGDVRLMTTTLLTKPLVKITQLGEITKTKITVVCKVVDSGGQPVTARGICWNTTGNPTLADNYIIDSTGLDDFTSTISGLTPNTVYYVSAYAINSVGTSYSNPLFSIFTLPYLAPTVTTNPISNYSHTMLTCGGTVTGEGDAPVTTRGLCWSTTHQFPTIDDNYIVEGGSGLGSFTSTISNLNPGEFVYVRAFASNNYKTGYGEQQSVFLPRYPEPTVIASYIQDLKRTSAVVKCNVQENYNHPVIARGVCWSTSPQPTLNDNHTVNGAGPGNYQSYITDLTPTTTYYLRAYAVTDQVTAYSNELEFTTIGFTYCDSITIPYACNFTIPEENQCWTIVDANNDDATFTFENSNWCVAYYGYHYESAQAVADEYLISPMIPFDGHKNVVRYKYWSSCNYIPAIYEVLAFGPDTVVLYPPDTVRTGVRTPKRLDVSNLNGNYAIAIHCISDNNRSCIEFSDFSVYEATLPEVSTENVGRVTDFTARCHGYWTDDGNADTEFGFCWSTSPNPTVNDSHLPEDVGQNYMHYFYTDLTGLTPGTHYYVRAYATNMVGTVYGEQLEFTTTLFSLNGIPCPGTPTITDVDNNTYNTVGLDGVCWMKENLRTTHYADNTPIAYGGNNLSTTTAYRYYPNNNINNVSTYGYLYNMAAVRHGVEVTSADTIGKQGICPTGWHVPSHDEYVNLFSTLNRHIDQYICYYDGSFGWYGGTAKALASTQGWTANYDPDEEIWPCSPVENPSTNNATNFSALPAGYRYGGNPDYYLPDEDFGKIALIWSYHGSVLHIEGRYPDAYFAWLQDDKFGCSVRCLRDRPLTFDY